MIEIDELLKAEQDKARQMELKEQEETNFKPSAEELEIVKMYPEINDGYAHDNGIEDPDFELSKIFYESGMAEGTDFAGDPSALLDMPEEEHKKYIEENQVEFNLGDKCHFEFYTYCNRIFVIVDGCSDIPFSEFPEEFQKKTLELLKKSKK